VVARREVGRLARGDQRDHDISAPGVAEVYIPGRALSALRRLYHLEETNDPNAVLHVVGRPGAVRAGVRVAPRPVVGLDLLDDDDERTRRTGRELLARPPTI
jgi:hypothetical protein